MVRRRSPSARSSGGRAKPAASIRLPSAWPAAALAIAVLLVYINSIDAPFLFDDLTSIVENPRIRQLWPLSVPLLPPRDTPVAGRPVVNLSFALNYALGGLRVRGYHLGNIAIHLLAALTLFGIVRRTLILPKLADRWGGVASGIAFACALIWALHPLATEPVSYLTERTELLMGVFYLTTLYASVRALDERGRPWWQVAAVTTCMLGMASKESMVTAPVIIVLFDRVFVFESFRSALRHRWRLYAGLAASWIVLAALMWSVPRTSVGFTGQASPSVYFLNQMPIVARYLWLAVWPHALVLDYGLPQPIGIREAAVPGVLILALGMMTVGALRYRPMLGFLGAWFFVTLAPTSSIIPIATEVGAERRMYLPLAGLVVLAVVAFVALRPKSTQRVRILVLAVVCAALAAGTVVRNREYRSRLTMAETIVERRPHGRAHFMLGSELIAAGRHDEAMTHFRQSSRDYPGARYALGTELIAAGDLDAGIVELQTFLRELPTHPNTIPAREMLARAFLAEGRFDEARQQLTAILKAVPTHAEARRLLGDAELSRGNAAGAIPFYQEFLASHPGDVTALKNLGVALGASGRVAEAITVFEQAASARPDDAGAVNLLGRALALQGRFQEAVVQFRRAVALDPSSTEARANLAAAEAAVGVRPR